MFFLYGDIGGDCLELPDPPCCLSCLSLSLTTVLSLLELVTDLGPVLTHSSAQVRVHGVGLLSSVLSHDHVVRGLSQQELDVIFTFYIDR